MVTPNILVLKMTLFILYASLTYRFRGVSDLTYRSHGGETIQISKGEMAG